MEPAQLLELLIRVLNRRCDLGRRLCIGGWRRFSGGRLFLLLGLGLLVPAEPSTHGGCRTGHPPLSLPSA